VSAGLARTLLSASKATDDAEPERAPPGEVNKMSIAEIYDRLRELLPYYTMLELFELRESQGDCMYQEIEALAKGHYELAEGDELDEILELIELLVVSKAPKTVKALSLDDYVTEVQSDIRLFAADWRAKNAANPEQYPMELPEDNAGLWGEFFTDFMNRDTP